MKTINRLVVIALLLLVVAGFLLAANDASAGGNGYCSTVRLVLGGCKPPVTCDIGRPIVNGSEEDGWYLECYYPPTAPVTGGPLTLLEPGQRTKFSCPAGIAVYAIFESESAVVVGCHD